MVCGRQLKVEGRGLRVEGSGFKTLMDGAQTPQNPRHRAPATPYLPPTRRLLRGSGPWALGPKPWTPRSYSRFCTLNPRPRRLLNPEPATLNPEVSRHRPSGFEGPGTVRRQSVCDDRARPRQHGGRRDRREERLVVDRVGGLLDVVQGRGSNSGSRVEGLGSRV